MHDKMFELGIKVTETRLAADKALVEFMEAAIAIDGMNLRSAVELAQAKADVKTSERALNLCTMMRDFVVQP